jgi:hypothetical protein
MHIVSPSVRSARRQRIRVGGAGAAGAIPLQEGVDHRCVEQDDLNGFDPGNQARNEIVNFELLICTASRSPTFTAERRTSAPPRASTLLADAWPRNNGNS